MDASLQTEGGPGIALSFGAQSGDCRLFYFYMKKTNKT